eukprot:14747623-Alexandrium_andersonii.AAC.1
MSASLVGSEMCIRDRFVGAGARQDISQQMAFAAWSKQIRQARASSTCPVSYTHLTLPTICSV